MKLDPHERISDENMSELKPRKEKIKVEHAVLLFGPGIHLRISTANACEPRELKNMLENNVFCFVFSLFSPYSSRSPVNEFGINKKELFYHWRK